MFYSASSVTSAAPSSGSAPPEITVKALVLSIILSAVLAGANAYLGLFAGMTVSASIPAAVVSMAVLRCFRRSNILENNIVQTAASSGEALAAGVIFTIPALLLIGHWQAFDYWQTTLVSLVGGLLGVLFTIPLRRALIVGAQLRFPEGVATAEVLKVGATSGVTAAKGFRTLLAAACWGGGMKLCESGLRLWNESLEGAVLLGRTVVYGGVNLSPALVGVGFIVGLNTAVVVFLGGVIGWLLLLPLYGAIIGVPNDLNGVAAAKAVWSQHIRYVGIGAMLVGGLWTLAQVRKPILQSLRQLRQAYAGAGNETTPTVPPRTERDASLPWILVPFFLSLIPMALIYWRVVGQGFVAVSMTLIMAGAAFLFSSVAAYMAGLVGSSSNPVSGVTIATIMVASLLLVVFMGAGHQAGPAATLLIGAVVCCAAAMGGDNLQDLKTGHLVGATPWKQQIMQVVGVLTAALVIVPVLSLLHAKYGIGEVTPAHLQPLSAPQATLMAQLALGVFGGNVPWLLVGLGAVVAMVNIGVDQWQRARGGNLRLPVLAVALGIYLPLKLSAAILVGGLIAEFSRRGSRNVKGTSDQRGLLFAAGLITGEALTGIVLALPVALSGVWPEMGADPLRVFDSPLFDAWPGVLMLILVGWLLYRAAISSCDRAPA